MKKIGYMKFLLIASFALGVFSDQANSQKMSESPNDNYVF
jgi:hypothetical protein